jgi:hypothetical protein
MVRRRTLAALTSSLLVVVAVASAATTSRPARAGAQDLPDLRGLREGDAYVVAYDGSAAVAERAVAAAGGRVVDVNDRMHVALVDADDAGFEDAVEARDGIAGATRNHSVGTSDPGMPHRYAEERPTVTMRRAAARAAEDDAAVASAAAPGDEPLADR